MGKGVQRVGSNLGAVASNFTAKGKQSEASTKLDDVPLGTSKGKQGRFTSKPTAVPKHGVPAIPPRS